MILIANKADLAEESCHDLIPEEEGRALANENGMGFMVTSAKTSLNVDAAFKACVDAVAERIREEGETVVRSLPGIQFSAELEPQECTSEGITVTCGAGRVCNGPKSGNECCKI